MNAALPFTVLGPWAFVLGACLGSFYAVCAQRYVAGRSLLGRSCCESCGQTLRVVHLVPLVSWLALGGRCGFCRKPIGLFAPFMEGLSGLVALALVWRFGPGPTFWLLLGVAGVLLVASGIDLLCCLLPDRLTLPLMVAAVPVAVWGLGLTLAGSALGALLAAALLGGLRWVFLRVRGVEALGLGDVKLVFALGGLCGLQAVPTLLLVAAVAGLCAAPCWLWRQRNWRAVALPFGPFLALGWLVTLLAG